MSSSSSDRASPRSPTVAFAITTAPVRRTGSTNKPARNPGIDPVWPNAMPEPTRESWNPSPCAETIAAARAPDCGVLISSSVAQGEHVGVAGDEERGVPRQVGDRAPHLTGRRHRARVEGRLGRERAGEVVHARAPRRAAPRAGSSCASCRAASGSAPARPTTTTSHDAARPPHRAARTRRSCSGRSRRSRTAPTPRREPRRARRRTGRGCAPTTTRPARRASRSRARAGRAASGRRRPRRAGASTAGR